MAMEAYEELHAIVQARIAAKKERGKNATGSKPVKSSKNKRVTKSQEEKESAKETNKTRDRELTSLLARPRARESIHHHEEGDMPKQSDFTALLYLWQ